MPPPPPTLHSSACSDPTTNDDTCRYTSIRGSQIQVPQGCPKGTQGQLVRDSMFIDDVTKDLKQNLH